MHQKGIEPFAQPWKGCMLPLHHWCEIIITDTNKLYTTLNHYTLHLKNHYIF